MQIESLQIEKIISEVSIGLPVFNGADSLENAIKSLLAQTFVNFELIISDNCSTDSTERICKQYATLDNRIKYVRQNKNIGATNNFKYVLSLASGEFFMWAAHDDLWESDFISRNLGNLKSNINAIASMSNVRLDGHLYSLRFSGAAPLVGKFENKLLNFLDSPGANSRFYSLFRRQYLIDIDLDNEYLASDWSTIVRLLTKGDMLTLTDYYGFHKSLGGAGSAMMRFRNSRKSWIEWFFPFAKFSAYVFQYSISPKVIMRLLVLNLRANKSRIKWSLIQTYKYFCNSTSLLNKHN